MGETEQGTPLDLFQQRIKSGDGQYWRGYADLYDLLAPAYRTDEYLLDANVLEFLKGLHENWNEKDLEGFRKAFENDDTILPRLMKDLEKSENLWLTIESNPNDIHMYVVFLRADESDAALNSNEEFHKLKKHIKQNKYTEEDHTQLSKDIKEVGWEKFKQLANSDKIIKFGKNNTPIIVDTSIKNGVTYFYYYDGIQNKIAHFELKEDILSFTIMLKKRIYDLSDQRIGISVFKHAFEELGGVNKINKINNLWPNIIRSDNFNTFKNKILEGLSAEQAALLTATGKWSKEYYPFVTFITPDAVEKIKKGGSLKDLDVEVNFVKTPQESVAPEYIAALTSDLEKIPNYFVDNEALESWKILHDLKIPLSKENLEFLQSYRTENSAKAEGRDLIIRDIEDAGGYDIWKNKVLGNPTTKTSWEFLEDMSDHWDTALKEQLKMFLVENPEAMKLFADQENDIKRRNLAYAWERLKDDPHLYKKKGVLESFSKINWIGEYGDKVSPVDVNDLMQRHQVSSKGNKEKISKLETSFLKKGYVLSSPIRVVRLSDGTLLLLNGHHRLQALKNLNIPIAPVEIIEYSEYPEINKLARFIEFSRFSGFYKGSFQIVSEPQELFKLRKEVFMTMDHKFSGWRSDYVETIINQIKENKYKTALRADLKNPEESVFFVSLASNPGLIDAWKILLDAGVSSSIRLGEHAELLELQDYIDVNKNISHFDIARRIKKIGYERFRNEILIKQNN
jgi:hypothetical protein